MSNESNYSSQIPGVLRTAARDDILDSVEVKSGTRVFASIVDANSDVSSFFPLLVIYNASQVSSFGPDVAAADFARAGVKSGITDFGAKG
jgi:hypothetical protein